jgi:hypothetical protein
VGGGVRGLLPGMQARAGRGCARRAPDVIGRGTRRAGAHRRSVFFDCLCEMRFITRVTRVQNKESSVDRSFVLSRPPLQHGGTETKTVEAKSEQMAPVASAVRRPKKDCVREIAAALRGAHVPSLVRRAGNVTRTLVARPVPRFVRRPRIERHRARVSRAGSGRGAALKSSSVCNGGSTHGRRRRGQLPEPPRGLD